MEKIIQYSLQKISSISLDYKRYLYNEIVELEEKIIGITWLRWVGKTTLLLQIARNRPTTSLYFSMDSVFIWWRGIFEVIENAYKNYGYRYFFIDEIHKYKNWEQDLKTLYDFFEDIRVYFSGSSSIDLIRWNYDLSRRGLLFHLHKFSFREYLFLRHAIIIDTYSINDILRDYQRISLSIYSRETRISAYFREYLYAWELGFAFDTSTVYHDEKLWNILNKIIYEDISSFYNLKTENIHYFFGILRFIANSSPSHINYSNIATLLSTTPDTVKLYIQILVEIWLIHIFWVEGKISQNLRKTKKILFELTSGISYFADGINSENTLWTIRESYVVSMLSKFGTLFYPEKWDILFLHEWDRYLFEVGWKSKKIMQIKNLDNAFLIKDEIDIGTDRILPIWLLWLCY